MELVGIGLAIWILMGFLFASIIAMLCRGYGKSTEMNPEFLATMGFFWSITPPAMFGASAYFPWLDLSFLAPFAFVLGLIPLFVIMSISQRGAKDNAFFGRDSQGRLSLFGCSPHEVVTTLLYGLLSFEIATIFLWDEFYRA
jgi:hypothetical protein